jgi:hypothetical protein
MKPISLWKLCNPSGLGLEFWKQQRPSRDLIGVLLKDQELKTMKMSKCGSDPTAAAAAIQHCDKKYCAKFQREEAQ